MSDLELITIRKRMLWDHPGHARPCNMRGTSGLVSDRAERAGQVMGTGSICGFSHQLCDLLPAIIAIGCLPPIVYQTAEGISISPTSTLTLIAGIL